MVPAPLQDGFLVECSVLIGHILIKFIIQQWIYLVLIIPEKWVDVKRFCHSNRKNHKSLMIVL